MSCHNNDRKIVLLETPFLSQTGTEEVKAYVQSKYNLALLSLGSYLKAYSSFRVSIINMVRDKISTEELLRRLDTSCPAVIGISLYSYNLSTTYRIITAIKDRFPGIHICVGGPHVNIYPKETAGLKHIDSIVLGDGEFPFLQICQQVIEGGGLDPQALPPGTYTRESLAIGVDVYPYILEDLNSLPLPDLTLLGDYKRYRDFLSHKVMGLLSSSRGCPFVCHYCRSQKSRYRSFSIEYTIDVMRYYKNMGVEYIEFWDETFNPNKKRLEQFADALLEANLGLDWSIRGAVVQHVSLEILEKLKRAGLRIIQFGVETTIPRLLRYLNKKINREQVEKAFALCHSLNIRTAANLMINIPDQTRKEILADLSFLKQLKPTYISISIYNWAPGTIHYENALKENVLQRDHWKEYAAEPAEPEPIIHSETEVPINEVYNLRSRFVNKHYFNFSYIFNYTKLINISEFISAIGIALLMGKSKIKILSKTGQGNAINNNSSL